MATNLSGHDKRVTLNLARLSACCPPELRASLKPKKVVKREGGKVVQLSLLAGVA